MGLEAFRRRVFNECPECHTVLKSSLALASHQGSRPCKLERTRREMEERGWKCAGNPAAERLFNDAGIEYESAPAVYSAGGWLDKSGKRHARKFVGPGRFTTPSLDNGVWAPAWAVTIVDASGFADDERLRILEWAQESVRHIDEMLVAIALGGIEVLSVYAKTKAYREVSDDS